MLESLVISSLVAISIGVGSFFIAQRAGMLPVQNALVSTYRETVKALQDRIAEMERQMARCSETALILQSEIDSLQAALATQAKEIARLSRPRRSDV